MMKDRNPVVPLSKGTDFQPLEGSMSSVKQISREEFEFNETMREEQQLKGSPILLSATCIDGNRWLAN